MNVANTILQQLGGNRFAVMTGAKNFVGSEDSLGMKVGRNSMGVSHIRVTLDPSDTYTIKAFSIRGGKVKEKGEESGVYCDMLQDAFLRLTGLYTRL